MMISSDSITMRPSTYAARAAVMLSILQWNLWDEGSRQHLAPRVGWKKMVKRCSLFSQESLQAALSLISLAATWLLTVEEANYRK